MGGVLAGGQTVPIYEPFLWTAWGVLWWFAGMRQVFRDPRGEMRKIAEHQAPLYGGDVERAFAWNWRLRWLTPVAFAGYWVGVLGLFVAALWG